MPALPVVANVIRFSIEGTTPGYPWSNVLYWGYGGVAPTTANLNDYADALFNAWVADFGPLMANTATIERATATDLGSTLGVIGAGGTTEVGSRGTVEIPASSAVLITKTIGRRYRGGHPRSYVFAGIQTDLVNSSHWAGAFVTAVGGAYSAMSLSMNGLVETGTNLTSEVCVSYTDRAVNPVPPYHRPVPLVLPVLGVLVQPEIANQRRRIGR